jgi:hypothetical protein
VRKPFPDWAEYRPNSIWIYDTTHFTASGMAVLIIEDLVSRKWITEVVSSEETSTQVELAFTAALELEGLLEQIEARHGDGRVDISIDDEQRPVLLAVSDNGPQMTSGSTREFMALHAIARHFGRPGTPTDQAWIESLNGHLKNEHPHLLAIRDPQTPRAELAVARQHYNTVRLHAGIGYVTPDDEHQGRGEAIRKAREAGLERARLRRLAWHRQHRNTDPTQDPNDVGYSTPKCDTNSDTRQRGALHGRGLPRRCAGARGRRPAPPPARPPGKSRLTTRGVASRFVRAGRRRRTRRRHPLVHQHPGLEAGLAASRVPPPEPCAAVQRRAGPPAPGSSLPACSPPSMTSTRRGARA